MSDYKIAFEPAEPKFIDRTDIDPPENEMWAPISIRKGQFEEEVDRLASLPAPANGRRSTLLVHPNAREDAPGLAPGIQVTLSVLLPGEETKPFRHNATEVNFCIRGAGKARIGAEEISFKKFDVWNHPSYTAYSQLNDTEEIQVWLTYSNVPILRHMQVYLWENDPPMDEAEQAPPAAGAETNGDGRAVNPFGTFKLNDSGAMLMPYETLINPPAVQSPILHWPWEEVERELEKLDALGQDYTGRRLYLLYNPMTGRTNGTTPNFFATITIRPPGIVDRPHRHVSASINYYFRGSGRSSVAGNVYEWEAGDMMLSAPGWAVHNHASKDDRVYELTIQDQPLNIAMESLLWQESMNEPPRVLGMAAGFETNRAAVGS